MDMSSCVVLTPPAAEQPPGSITRAEALQSAAAAAAAAAASDSLDSSSLQQQQAQADGTDTSLEQQQQQPFWQQASQWALNLLPSELAGSQLTASAAAAAAAAAACKHEGLSSSALKSAQQYDVHAMTSTLKEGLQDTPAATADPAAATKQSAAAAAAAERDAAVPAGPSVSPTAAAAAAARPGSISGSSVRRNSMSGGSDVSSWLLFEVEDTGVGITRDGLATLFREYVQGTEDEMCKPRTRGGTGLGLSICSKQVGNQGVNIFNCKTATSYQVYAT
jgi:hypothetical protein